MELVINVTATLIDVQPLSELSELVQSYAKWNGPDLFAFVSKLLHLLSDADQRSPTLSFAENAFFSLDARTHIQKCRKTHGATVHCISRQQLLCALKFIALVAPSEGGLVLSTEQERFAFGELLSQTSEFFPEDTPTSRDANTYDLIDGKDRFPAQFLSRYLIENGSNFAVDFIRFYDTFFEHLPAVLPTIGQPADWLDILFVQHMGVTFEDCFLFALVVSNATYQYSLSDIFQGRPGFARANLQAVTSWSPQTFQILVDLCCCTRQEYARRILRCQRLPFEYDFEVFRDAPIQMDGENLYVLDAQFLIDCVGDRLLHRLMHIITQEQKNSLAGALGKAFELLCIQSLTNARHPEHSVEALTPGRKQVDIEVQAGATRIFIEVCKANWDSEPRYSGNPSEVGAELRRLDRELIQLAYAIAKFAEMDSGATKEIIPLLVGMDRSLGSYFVQSTLNRRFQSELKTALKGKPSSYLMRRLIVMNADDYQSVCQLVANGRPLKDLLHAVVAEDPDGVINVSAVYTRRRYTVSFSDAFQVRWNKALEKIKGILGPEVTEGS